MASPRANTDMDYEQLRHGLESGKKVPTKSATVINKAGSVVTPLVANVVANAPAIQGAMSTLSGVPILQNAIAILDKIGDLGKDMPFVAPAFVLLKFVIEVEKKAREADAKCNDLLERITFMLSQLPALKNVTIIEPTRMVIERMNGVLKDAAALIGAYRKQGAVARRLSIHNRDKFTASVDAINGCSKDLMMSLQIHQTTRLDILTRAVPNDPEDQAAQEFVALHGNLDAVKQNPELVSKFAQEHNMKMDDEVMEQLNTNLTDTMQQTMGRLEDMIKGNVSEAIIDGLKGLAAEMNAKEAQQRFKCVQCEKEFTASTNGPQSCSFHRAPYDSWIKKNPCCGSKNPCEFQSHRSEHHCDYPYGLFFAYSSGILNYIDTVEKWISVEDTDLETGKERKTSAGRLLRWASRAHPIADPTVLITIGTIWFDKPYYFRTFTAEDLQSVAESIRLTRKTVIYRTSPSLSDFEMAEWVVSSTGKISGIRLTAKCATSDAPFIRVCLIDAATCAKSGDILTLSEGGLRSYQPATPYTLPATVRVCPEVLDVPLRPVRTDFKTRSSPSFRVILKTMSDPPLKANDKWANEKFDYFQGEVSVFNNNPAGSANPITIASVSAAFRLVGDKEYRPVLGCEVHDISLPVTIEPRQSWLLKFQAMVPRTEEDAKLKIRLWNRAFSARHRPLRLKLTLEDMEGEECSTVLEYVYAPYAFDKLKEQDIAFFYFDDPVRVERYGIHVTKGDQVISINGTGIEAKKLKKIVYQALKSGESEIDIGIGQEKDEGIWEWKVWALVDLTCRHVYAFKILLNEGRRVDKKRFGCLGYVLCPSYGDVINETRPIRGAVEKVKRPEFEVYNPPELVTDDKFDDFVPEPPKAALAAPAAPDAHPVGNGVPPQSVVSEDLSNRLASIDSSLIRIAEALEQLVDIGGKRN
ncbi:hypothetical protein K439DRAFT_1399034 [Ramaria rubella]|nr:hypothetical protein K439DRAFT_1399034 [Ramaria rubella]